MSGFPSVQMMIALPQQIRFVGASLDVEPCPFHGDGAIVEGILQPNNAGEWLPIYICMTCYELSIDGTSNQPVWTHQPQATYDRLVEIYNKHRTGYERETIN